MARTPAKSITVNGKVITKYGAGRKPRLQQRYPIPPRLTWHDLCKLAGKLDRFGRSSNKHSVTYTLPGNPRPQPFSFGHSLLVEDGMKLTVI